MDSEAQRLVRDVLCRVMLQLNDDMPVGIVKATLQYYTRIHRMTDSSVIPDEYQRLKAYGEAQMTIVSSTVAETVEEPIRSSVMPEGSRVVASASPEASRLEASASAMDSVSPEDSRVVASALPEGSSVEPEDSEASYIAFTDGSANPNPGPGGWGVAFITGDGIDPTFIEAMSEDDIISMGGIIRRLAEREARTTNNRMEIMGAISAIEHFHSIAHPGPDGRIIDTLHIFTDSRYTKQGITSWVRGWKRNGWRTSKGGAVKNQDLWERLDTLNASHSIVWHWCAAHQGTVFNEIADRLAGGFMDPN